MHRSQCRDRQVHIHKLWMTAPALCMPLLVLRTDQWHCWMWSALLFVRCCNLHGVACRYGLVRVRENAEAIAFYRGDEDESQLLRQVRREGEA